MPPARRNTDQESLAGTASERVRAIIEAAESSAAAIRADAEAEADRIRKRAEERATELRSEVRSDVRGLIASLRDGMDRLRGDLERLEQQLGAPEPPAEHAPEPPAEGQPAPRGEAVAAAGIQDDADIALAEDAAVDLDEPEASRAGGDADLEGARLVALNMALDGTPRGEVESHLRERYGLTAPAELLDQVYESIGRT